MDKDSSYEIILCARNSYVGEMIYRKYNRYHTGYEMERKQVIPVSVGYSPKNKKVLFAEDYRERRQIKMFIIDNIVRFESTKREVRTSFPIKLKKIFDEFSKYGVREESDESEKNASVKNKEESIIAKIMQFSGSEANLYRKKGDADEYNEISF